EQAQAALAESVESLTAAERELDQRFRLLSRSRRPQADPLPPAKLEELLTRTRLLLGTAELERARLTEGQARTDRLAAAERWLTAVAKGPVAEEPTWRAQVSLAEAARLAGKPDLVRRRLTDLSPASLPEAAKDAIAAVSAKLLLDENKPDRAVQFLIDYRQTRGSLTGELRLLQVRGLAAAAAAVEALGKADEAAALRAQIPTVLEWTQAEHGGYWAYRARLAARNAEKSARYGPEVAAQVRRAEAALASGETEEAAAAYATAAELASGDPELAAELASARASVLLAADRFEEAASAFAALAEKAPESSKAAEAHLLSGYALGRLHDAEPSAERREAYVARLEEHRTRFAGSPTAAEATLRLARLYEQRRQYSKALPLLKEITGDAERGPAAAAALARNYESLLQYLKSAAKAASDSSEAAARQAQLAEWSFAAVRDLTSLTEPLRSDAPRPRPFSMQEAELALRASRILQAYADDPSAADRLLDRLAEAVAAEHLPEEKAFWESARRSSLPLRVVSLASRNRYEEAGRLIDSLADAPAGDLLAVVDGLSELSDSEAGRQRPAVFGATGKRIGPRLTDLRRTATEMLAERRAELSPEEARRLDVVLARANLADGRSAVALDRFEAALAERPNDKALLAQAATALLASGDPEAVRQARDYGRRLEGLEPPGSEAWLRARLRVIEAHVALGETAEARKLLTVTRLLHPRLGGGETKAAYDALQRRLDAATAETDNSDRR
ncbi:MAG TPA: hypothetical protein VF170_10260, partial [Planctomycetaceae bacterium]